MVDKDGQRARRCADKNQIGGVFRTIEELTQASRPDVIHIVTPPRSHFSMAEAAIKGGCHVLIEKPLAINLEQAEGLFVLAEECGVTICTMHNHFYDPCMMSARALVAQGKLGKIINVESYYGLNTRIDAFRKYPLPNVLPWIYELPGGVFQDFLSHPLYVMLPFIGKPEEIQLSEKSFGELPQNLSDELRVLIRGERAFGNLTVSFAAKPHLHFLRIYGTKMMLTVDFNTNSTTFHPVSRLPKAAQKATYNLDRKQTAFLKYPGECLEFWARKAEGLITA